MATSVDFGGWVISTIAGWFVVTADSGKTTKGSYHLETLAGNPRGAPERLCAFVRNAHQNAGSVQARCRTLEIEPSAPRVYGRELAKLPRVGG